MQPARVNFTWRDAHLLPEDNDYEILDGDLLALPFPDAYHRRIAGNLEAALRRQIGGMGWGEIFHRPCGVVLSKTTLVMPDLFLIRNSRLGIIHGGKALGAPDLMIEIVSNNSQEGVLRTKRRLYAHHGVREYWVLSLLARRVEVFIWSEVGYVMAKSQVASECTSSLQLPMLRIPLAKIFSDCDPCSNPLS
jgi:Uma2 family endonuclease